MIEESYSKSVFIKKLEEEIKRMIKENREDEDRIAGYERSYEEGLEDVLSTIIEMKRII